MTGQRPPEDGLAEDGPLVVACLRICDLTTAVDPLSGTVTSSPFGIGLSPADSAALEHALRLAEALSGRVLAVACGPPSIDPVLRSAIALGAEALRVPCEEDDRVTVLAGDEHALARRLHTALSEVGPVAVVVCGAHSADRGTGALPAFLAHELGASQALGLITLGAAGDGSLDAERRLDGGWRELLRVPLPAVCSVEATAVRLRRASLPALLATEARVIPTSAAGAGCAFGTGEPGGLRFGAIRPYTPPTRVVEAPASPDPRLRTLALTGALEARDPPALVGPVGPDEAADHLLEFLRRHGHPGPEPAMS
ncbi:MAG: mycofactocin-associated electron transfer flavoprotein beta subunit [Acidimicrobiales bacterium]